MGNSIDVSDLNRLAVEMKNESGTIGLKAAAAFKKTAYSIERDGKAFCPVDTGNLRNSISTSVLGDGRFASIEIEIGPTADYAVYVEQGTSVHAPQAFMGPAADRNLGTLVSALDKMAGEIL